LTVRNAFTHVTDFFHALLGFVSAILIRFPYGSVVALAILIIFLIYESIQKEESTKSYQDILEFVVGWVIGAIIILSL